MGVSKLGDDRCLSFVLVIVGISFRDKSNAIPKAPSNRDSFRKYRNKRFWKPKTPTNEKIEIKGKGDTRF